MCILLVSLVLGSSLQADYTPFNGAAVAPNIAEVRIENQGISVQLEIYVGDIPTFETLLPDDWMPDAPADRPGLAARLEEFAQTGLSVRRDDGTALPVKLNLIEPRLRVERAPLWAGQRDPVTGRIAPEPPEDKRVVFAELFYAFENARPDAVTIVPPKSADQAPPAIIGMLVFDRSVPVTKFGFLSAGARLAIDWTDPWYSRFDNPNLKRHHQSALTTYLYLEPREVRHEILIRVPDLAGWIDLGVNDATPLSVEVQDRIKSLAVEFLKHRNPVTINGKAVKPTSSLTSFLTVTDTGLQIVENEGPLDPLATFVGVILSFPVPALPDTATINWDMFNDRVAMVPATLTDPVGPFLSGATPDSPQIEWTNYLRAYQDPQVRPVQQPGHGQVYIPLMSLGLIAVALTSAFFAITRRGTLRIAAMVALLAGIGGAATTRQFAIVEMNNPLAGPPDTENSVQIFSALLENINSANLETDAAVEAQLLETVLSESSKNSVMAELDRALSVRIAGGGLARVHTIRDISMSEISTLPEGTGFQSLAEWTAIASAGHWGHDHRRNLRYRALVEVEREEGAWKLSGITVIETRDVK